MYKQLIIDTCKEYNLSRDEAAYVLGTIHWETNGTFEPVREAYWVKNAEAWRKKNLRYYPWYGRGFIQLTWEYNYKKAGEKIGVDLIKDPDLAMDPKNSAKIAVLGMKEGWFTGKDLDDYIDSIPESDKEDFLEFYNARRIVNGMDKANNIAVLAERYEKELVNYDSVKTNPVDTKKTVRTLLAIIIAILKRIFKK